MSYSIFDLLMQLRNNAPIASSTPATTDSQLLDRTEQCGDVNENLHRKAVNENMCILLPSLENGASLETIEVLSVLSPSASQKLCSKAINDVPWMVCPLSHSKKLFENLTQPTPFSRVGMLR